MSAGILERIRTADRRFLGFVVVGLALVVLATSGIFNAKRDVEIGRDEAIAIAQPLIDFEPENSDARLVRQGFQMTPVWAVWFTVPVENDPRTFERRMTVEIDARTGEVLRVGTDGEGTVQPDN